MTAQPVLFEEVPATGGKSIGIATLNVERTLNSLSLPMIELLTSQLRAWQDHDNVAMVILQGAGDKAFCAGGDIQDLYRSMVENPGGPNEYAERFFEHEYRLDYLIHTYEKPILVWANGVVMGGGLGIMAGCSHRIGTETSRIAMPEITIGLFPDAGATWFLARMPTHWAHFLAWTGSHLNAVDARKVGLVDRLIDFASKDDVKTALTTARWGTDPGENEKILDNVLDNFESSAGDFPESQLDVHENAVKSIVMDALASDSPVEVFAEQLDTLEVGDDKWLKRAVQTFKGGSPTTAHLIREQIDRAKGLSLKETLMLELVMAIQCSRHHDFAEGVRALLIDKDNSPQWKYTNVSDVPRHWIESHFATPWEGENPLSDLSDQ